MYTLYGYYDKINLLVSRLKNLKDAKDCQVAGGAKKLVGLPVQLANEVFRKCGPDNFKVLRIVRNGQVFFGREYTRMIKRNASVVLLSNGIVGDIHFFIWNKTSGRILVVYKVIEPNLDKPFFFDDAGCHILRMKSQRYSFNLNTYYYPSHTSTNS